jgi:hypothetical protein
VEAAVEAVEEAAAVEAAVPRPQVPPVGLSPVQGTARLQVSPVPLLVLFPLVMPAFAPNYRQPLLFQVDPSWL